jgi:hypothetical protein
VSCSTSVNCAAWRASLQELHENLHQWAHRGSHPDVFFAVEVLALTWARGSGTFDTRVGRNVSWNMTMSRRKLRESQPRLRPASTLPHWCRPMPLRSSTSSRPLATAPWRSC